MNRPTYNKHYEDNMANVIEECENYLDFMDKDNSEFNEDGIDDYRYRIFESVMEALYGKDIWKFINIRRM
jgi:hypothetical protein